MKKEEGRRKKEEGRRKKEDGRRKKAQRRAFILPFDPSTLRPFDYASGRRSGLINRFRKNKEGRI